MGRMHVDRFSLVASMVLVSSLVSGCADVRNYFGGVDNREKPAELAELEGQQVAIETIWSEDVGSGVENQYLRLTPVIAEGRVFAANGDGDVTCYDAQTGKKLWSRDLEVAITGGPGTDGDVVVVGSDDGDVVAMLAGGGDELWRARVSTEILAAPRLADGVVVVRTIDGKLFGIDRSSGKRRWIYDRSVPVLTLRGTSPPAVARGIAVNGFDSGRLVAVSIEDGETVWEARLATPRGRTELERLVDIDAEPLIVDGTVFAVTYQGRIAALDLLTGDVLWRRDMSSHAGLTVDNDQLYVTDDKSHVWALDRDSSASVWRQQTFNARDITAPGVLGQWVVVGDLQGYVHWLDRDDGQPVARVRVGSDRLIAAPIVVGDTVYVYSTNGTLAALRPRLPQ